MSVTKAQKEQAEQFIEKMNRIEEEAPRYDVEYHVDAEENKTQQEIVMAAHAKLDTDLDGVSNVPTNTTVEMEHCPDGVASVMITVAAEVKRSVFEEAEAKWMVHPGNKHWLWCCKDFETKDSREHYIEGGEDDEYPVEEIEIEFLR